MAFWFYAVVVFVLVWYWRKKRNTDANTTVIHDTTMIHGVAVPSQRLLAPITPSVYDVTHKGEFPRGGEKYFCPIGWTEYKLAFVPLDCFEWPIAYHGTQPKHVPSIALIG